MIVADSTARNDYIGDTAITQFPYTFGIVDENEIEVLSAGVALVLNSNYTVSGVGEEGGGIVTILPAPAAGISITLLRKQTFQQASVYTPNEDFPAKRLEKDLNKVVMALQQLKELSQRSLKFAKKSLLSGPVLPDGVVGQLMRWKSTTELENIASTVFVPGSVTLPLSIANGGTAAITAALARTSLGAAGLTDANSFTKIQRNARGADIASASTLSPGTDGNYFQVTGSTGITVIASLGAGTKITLEFDSGLTLTHHATNLILRGATNYVAAAKDTLTVIEYQTGKWIEVGRTSVAASNLMRGHLGGLRLLNNAVDVTNDIDFQVGEAVSDDALIANRVLLNAGAMTKRLDAVWAAGSAAGGLAAADNLTGAKTLAAWIFRRTGGVDDYFFSTSLSPTIPDSGTKKRRIGWVLWDGSKVQRFIQYGDQFNIYTPLLDVDATNPGTAAVTYTLASIPVGAPVEAILNVVLVMGAVVGNVYLSDLGIPDVAPSFTVAPLGQIGNTAGAGSYSGQVRVRTNALAQIRSRLSGSDGSTILKILPTGWLDTRGRED
jgi:hypothetical protein